MRRGDHHPGVAGRGLETITVAGQGPPAGQPGVGERDDRGGVGLVSRTPLLVDARQHGVDGQSLDRDRPVAADDDGRRGEREVVQAPAPRRLEGGRGLPGDPPHLLGRQPVADEVGQPPVVRVPRLDHPAEALVLLDLEDAGQVGVDHAAGPPGRVQGSVEPLVVGGDDEHDDIAVEVLVPRAPAFGAEACLDALAEGVSAERLPGVHIVHVGSLRSAVTYSAASS